MKKEIKLVNTIFGFFFLVLVALTGFLLHNNRMDRVDGTWITENYWEGCITIIKEANGRITVDPNIYPKECSGKYWYNTDHFVFDLTRKGELRVEARTTFENSELYLYYLSEEVTQIKKLVLTDFDILEESPISTFVLLKCYVYP